MIRLQNLHKYYNRGRTNEIHVINDVSLALPERGMVALFGRSGCGKTTLLNVIGGLDEFAEGSVTVDGQSIRKDTDALRNRTIGYIFQNYNLHRDKTCFENVAYALRLCGMRDEAEIERRVTLALSGVGMEQYAKRTPDTLSGGQQQRVAIARAIVKNPRIILADEPTGNLDEANTVQVMDLLRAIAKDHLVLLVTHEANLVDHYCDSVIELSDGRVVGIRHNADADGLAVRNKNHVYLGELEKRHMGDETVSVDYYGAVPEEPIRLRVVNQGGRLYLQVDSSRVQVLDETSEVCLCEGKYIPEENSSGASRREVDMSALPPIEGQSYGRLFGFSSSVRSGYEATFRQKKKGRKLLRRCMALFAAVIVLMGAVFGTSLAKISEASDAYNHNVFYVYTPTAEVSAILADAVGAEESGIDDLRLDSHGVTEDRTLSFRTGSFETFQTMGNDVGLTTNAVLLSASLAEGRTLLAGKNAAALTPTEILISSHVADALLEVSTFGYIREYADLVGLVSDALFIDGVALRIAGVVDSNETAVYLHELTMARYALNRARGACFAPASAYGETLEEGRAMLLVRQTRTDAAYPLQGETVTIHGRRMTVERVLHKAQDYAAWIAAKGITKSSFSTYVAEKYGTDAEEMLYYYEYLDYVYAEAGEYLAECYLFDSSCFEAWVYLREGLKDALYFARGDQEDECYRAKEYQRLYGRYPTPVELEAAWDRLPSLSERLDLAYTQYGDLFYREERENFGENLYLVSDADYIAIAKRLGETDPTAMQKQDLKKETGALLPEGATVWFDDAYGRMLFTVLHSTDPERTAAWLDEALPELRINGGRSPVVTPEMQRRAILEDNLEMILRGVVTIIVILILMSVCMYFIMRSALMNRIKEVGIYRAIGVSKRNLVFRFLVEAGVLTALTVLVGFVLTSGFVWACMGMSSLFESVFYYPVWYALLLGAILVFISLFCGTLPILTLLRKTPSEILAKYDI